MTVVKRSVPEDGICQETLGRFLPYSLLTEFAVKAATMPKEIASLLETGFECIMTKDDLAYFRKRK